MPTVKPAKYADLSPAQRRALREAYTLAQEGACMFCGVFLSCDPPETVTSKTIDWRRFPPKFLRYPVHLQHDHRTGMTEGAVHAYCNAVMWQYHGR